jgi:glycosyltransferase involved in cell wall biosynthesis
LTPFATVPNAVGPAPPPGERLANVLAVGRLVDQKNHELAIRAITKVPDATLAIVGDGPLRGQLERLAAELGAPVIFAGVRRDARALMGAADVVVMSSRWEGLPLSALEALASGTPLVATNVRGLRELVTDGENALLVPEDPDALAAALRRVLDDPKLAARLSQAGKQVDGAGSDEELVAGFLAIYEKLAAG